LLLTDDPYPNRRGCRDLGLGPAPDGLSAQQILLAVREGRIKGFILVGSDLRSMFGEEATALLGKLEWLILVHHLAEELYQKATVALPMAVYAERSGTFTNVNGLVQKFERAIEPLGQSLPQWQIWQTLAARLGAKWHYDDERAVFQDLAKNRPAYDTLNWHATFGVKPAFYHDDWYGW
jgi:formate dehydrogenase major subunit